MNGVHGRIGRVWRGSVITVLLNGIDHAWVVRIKEKFRTNTALVMLVNNSFVSRTAHAQQVGNSIYKCFYQSHKNIFAINFSITRSHYVLLVSFLRNISCTGEGSYMVEHGNWPLLTTEFWKIAYIFCRILENRNIVGHRNFVFWRTEYGKVPTQYCGNWYCFN